MAAVFANGIAVGIYATNSPEMCQYMANHSRCNILVVEDEKQLEKILKVKSELTDLKAIVQYTGTPKHEGNVPCHNLTSFHFFLFNKKEIMSLIIYLDGLDVITTYFVERKYFDSFAFTCSLCLCNSKSSLYVNFCEKNSVTYE